jgi:hypothetical protein
MRSIAPAQICTADFPLNTPFPVHIFRHTGQWIDGKAMQIRRDAPTLIVNVPRGTFGGPVITTAGRLLGVVSWSGSADPEPADYERAEPADADQIGQIPRLHLTAMAAPPHGTAVIRRRRPGPMMAWSFRLGPFRLNLSKSGLGASVGDPAG